MRKDIQIHIQTGDIVLGAQNQYKLRDFQWVSNPTGLTRYIYGEITIPAVFTENLIKNEGFYIQIPYTPKYKEFMVRIKREYTSEDYSYIQNPVDGSNWFLVKVGMYGGELENAFASQLRLISNSDYYCAFNGGIIQIYSAKESDFNIVICQRQNANMLLACVPTNNYRYPISGVGLIRWTNGNMSKVSLADRIMSEFNDDGVIVKNAAYDYDTKQMSLDLKEME